jgi:hypothetical protein
MLLHARIDDRISTKRLTVYRLTLREFFDSMSKINQESPAARTLVIYNVFELPSARIFLTYRN